MKNKLFMFLFLVLSFVCCSNVNASTKVGINYDANKHFNYFYEMKNNTPFYNLLQDYDSFQNTYGLSNCKSIFIFYTDDIFITSKGEYGSKYGVACNEMDDNSYLYSSYSDGSFNIYTDTSFNGKILYFDEDVNLVKTYSSGYIYLKSDNYSSRYDLLKGYIADRKEESMANFSYYVSSIYKSNIYKNNHSHDFRINYDDFVVTDIILNEQRYLIDDNNNYSSIKIALRNFFGGKDVEIIDSNNTPLEFFRDNIISKTKTFDLETLTKYGKTINAPEGFSSVSLNNDFIFIPKDVNNSALNRKFYSATTEQIYTSKVKANFNLYDLIDGSSLTEDTKLLVLSYKTPFTLYSFNPDTIAKKVDSSYSGTDYYIAFTNQNSKYYPSVYYNPNAYYKCEYGYDSNADPLPACTFINPKTGNEQTLTQDQMHNLLAQNDSTGASIDIFSSAKEQCKVAKDYSELYEYDDNCNIIGVNSSFGGSGNALKYISNFTSTIYSLFSYVSTLFLALPIEIQSLFYFLLFGGIAIILYRLIRGS